MSRYDIDSDGIPFYVSIESDVDIVLLQIVCRKIIPFIVTTVDIVQKITGELIDTIHIPSKGRHIVQFNDVSVSFEDGHFVNICKNDIE